jgi:hypothetical protein
LFYDRKGRDWDATITKIVDNPISIRQAFWAPYKKAARMIQEQIAKRAATADEAAAARMAQAAARLEAAAQKGQAAPAPATPPPAPQKVDPGMIAALSVGAAGLGATLGAILTGFLNLKWMMPMGVLGIILIISGPSMILAWLKLRRRNLGPILDANGWAVNAKAKINVPFGASLTQVAILPPNALRDRMKDPFAEKKRPWKTYCVLAIILVVALLWVFGKLDNVLPDAIKSDRVLHRRSSKPTAEAPVPAPAQNSAPAAGSK